MVIIENESHKCSGIRIGRIVTFPFSSDFAHDFYHLCYSEIHVVSVASINRRETKYNAVFREL